MRHLCPIRALTVVAAAVATLACAGWSGPNPEDQPARRLDVHWVATPDPVVEAMLDLAGVTADDVVYDLGSGDGKIVIAAARRGARAVGIDLDPVRVRESERNARDAGVADRTRFILGDIFDPAIRIDEATVVTMYLLQGINIRLMPRLQSELHPGTRVVSHTFSMGGLWEPDEIATVDDSRIFLWRVR